MGFQLSGKLDRDKIFLVKRSELEGRLDPQMALYQRKTTLFRFKTARLSSLMQCPPAYGANEAGIPRNSEEEPRYIRITDIDEHGILKQGLGKSAQKIEKKYVLGDNDLLFARSGATVGKTYIHKITNVAYLCFYAGYMIKFKFNEEQVLPDYVFAYTQLKTYKEWVSAIQRAAGQPNINAEEYKLLKIPLPPFSIQATIVDKVNAAYAAKKAKEAEAQLLLDSIDDYLLQELAIELPEEGENTIQDRMFFRKFSETSGGRFDPLFHSGGLYGFMGEVRYEMCKLQRITHYMKSGFAAGKDEQSKDSKAIIQIRPTNITAEGQFIFARNVYIATAEIEKHKSDLLEDGEILFNNTNSQEQVGKTVYFDKGEQFFCSNHITRVKTVESLDAQYCTELFNFYKKNKVFFKLCTNWNNQSGIGLDVLARVSIPLPPITKQQEIATHIETIRTKAKQLHKQAAADLEEAKQEVEVMILGEEGK